MLIGFVYPDFDFFVLFLIVFYNQRISFGSIEVLPRFVVGLVLLNLNFTINVYPSGESLMNTLNNTSEKHVQL
jgi:hypothetical protein